MKKFLTTNNVLWIIYLSLLAVLLPHTAWAFAQFEPVGSWEFTPYLAALAFEAAIAALTHKLAKHIESGKRHSSAWRKFQYQYLNIYSLGLISCLAISSLANLAHAVEFGTEIKIFTVWGVPFGLYAVVFGAVLPCISYVFARVLSNAVDEDSAEDPATIELRSKVGELNRQLRESERAKAQAERLTLDAERKAQEAEARFAAAGDLMRFLCAPEKRERILFAKKQWPQLTGSAIAIMTESQPSYVSEVLSGAEAA